MLLPCGFSLQKFLSLNFQHSPPSYSITPLSLISVYSRPHILTCCPVLHSCYSFTKPTLRLPTLLLVIVSNIGMHTVSFTFCTTLSRLMLKRNPTVIRQYRWLCINSNEILNILANIISERLPNHKNWVNYVRQFQEFVNYNIQTKNISFVFLWEMHNIGSASIA